MKKSFISLVFIVLLSLFLTSPAFANGKNDKLEELAEQGEITYQDDDITVRYLGDDQDISDIIINDSNSVIADDVNLRAVGPGGKAVITAGSTGRILYWTVRPSTYFPYHFQGNVHLGYYSGFQRNAPISGMGALGKSVSGTITMNKNNGGYATLTGSAYSMDFIKRVVLPGVGVSF